MRERIFEISEQEKLTHVGSNLSMADVLQEVYEVKKPEDIVILDAGHAHLAHLVAQEKFENRNIDGLISHDIHCNQEAGCDVSTGSLGLGITVALGRAMADNTRDVYCILSDGGCAEGTVWESLRIKSELQLDNLKIYVNANGWSALGPVDVDLLEERLHAFDDTVRLIRTDSDFGQTTGLDAHYKPL